MLNPVEAFGALDLRVGRLLVAAVNLEPHRIADFMSEVLVLGVPNERGDVVLLAAEPEVPLGGRVY